MLPSQNRELIHKVNNLLAVIYTQVEVGRSAGSLAAAEKALETILRAAQDTAPIIKMAAAASRAEPEGRND